MSDTDDTITESDRAALQLALDLTLTDDLGEGQGRVDQITDFLREPERWDRTWYDTAKNESGCIA
jgi:hypothetical protein